jgi:hypothetical protein
LSFEINGIFQLLNKNTYFIGKSLEIQPTAATTAAAAAAAAPSIIISSLLLVHTSYLQKGEGRVKLLSFQNTTRSGQVKLLASNTCSKLHLVSKRRWKKAIPLRFLAAIQFSHRLQANSRVVSMMEEGTVLGCLGRCRSLHLSISV